MKFESLAFERAGQSRCHLADEVARRLSVSPFTSKTVAPPLPGSDDPLNHRVQFRFEVLLLGVLAEPRNRLANADGKGFAAAKLRDEALDLRIVEHAGMGLVAFERAGQFRRHLADEVSRRLIS